MTQDEINKVVVESYGSGELIEILLALIAFEEWKRKSASEELREAEVLLDGRDYD